MRRIRLALPWLWVIIGALIAASLVRLAFAGDSQDDDRLTPTGTVPPETVQVQTGTVENRLTIDGTIELDAAQPVKAPADGVIVHQFVPAGAQVEKGAPIYQVRSTDEAPAAPVGEDGEAEPAKPRYTYRNATAPISGKVGAFSAENGDDVTKGSAVADVQPLTFKAVGSITPLDRYRLIKRPKEATITIKGGPEPFTCTGLVVGDAASTGTAGGGDEEGPNGPMMGLEEEGGGSADAASQVTCVVPDSVTVFDGLAMTMDIVAGSAKDVLVVPVTAVRGLLGAGTVWVLGDDGQQERSVELGVTDGKNIEVKSGLKEGDAVLRYVPGSDGSDGEDTGFVKGQVIIR